MAAEPYIRWRDPDDLGVRPPGASLVTTPAISIVKPTGMGLDPDPAIAYAEIMQEVRVEVSNKGDQDADATVTAWAFGFGTTSKYSGSFGGVIGRSLGVVIPAGSTGTMTAVQFPWKPQAVELGGAQRHFCIRANVFVDPADQQPDPNAPAGTAPAIDLTNIRHAQRNMTLLPKPMNLKKAFEFELAVGNPDQEEAQELRFEVREVGGELEPNEIAHLLQTRWIDREFQKTLVLPCSGGDFPVIAARRPAREVVIELGEDRGEKLVAKLDAGEDRAMRLRMLIDPGDAGEVHRFDVVQHDREGLVGSARVMTLGVPDELLERVKRSEKR